MPGWSRKSAGKKLATTPCAAHEKVEQLIPQHGGYRKLNGFQVVQLA
jgi:hypothetical protein